MYINDFIENLGEKYNQFKDPHNGRFLSEKLYGKIDAIASSKNLAAEDIMTCLYSDTDLATYGRPIIAFAVGLYLQK